MITCALIINPAWTELISRIPKLEDVEIKHIITDVNHGQGISVFWVKSKLEGLNLISKLTEIFPDNKIRLLEVEEVGGN